jgi:hypothetical protein
MLHGAVDKLYLLSASVLKMEATFSFETSFEFKRATRRYILRVHDRTLLMLYGSARHGLRSILLLLLSARSRSDSLFSAIPLHVM